MDITTKFSDKVKHLEASAIREIFKLLAKPGIISFAGGAPDPELFPKKEFAEIVDNNSATSQETAAVSEEQTAQVATMVQMLGQFKI